MPYSAEQIEFFGRKLEEWGARKRDLSIAFVMRSYRQERSRVLATQGFARRLNTLIRCIEQVYEIIPPDLEDPSPQVIQDAAIWLQAFVINVYGVVDNLARLWVWEADVREKGKPIPQMHIGLTPDNATVRKSLSRVMQKYLSQTDAWFKYLYNFRHALAHRIPLYIPPKRLDHQEAAEWERLEREKAQSFKTADYNLCEEITLVQSRLGVFDPCMMHEYGPDAEHGKPVWFHPQIICDLATVIEIGEMMLRELDALPERE